MKFKYIGECASGFTTVGKVEFPAGKAVDIKDADLCKTLSCNNHFEQVKTKAKKVKPVEVVSDGDEIGNQG